MPQAILASPVGTLRLVEENGALTHLDWESVARIEETPLLREAAHQLRAYFAGSRTVFDLPLAPRGTAFQQRVWQAMLAVPHGKTATYGDLARMLGTAARAVGTACGRNPLPIIIPCHRILAAAGASGGYSGFGGLSTKHRLLEIESGRTDLFTGREN